MPEIAVIVPVYKAEAHLNRCVDSILSQTYSNICLILVDDGSPDRCPGICDGYAAADPRVHVIHQNNAGPSRARNAGIDWAMNHTACGWISFVDSDDCVHPEYLHRLYSAIRITGAGAAMCMHQYINRTETLSTAQQRAPGCHRLMDPETLMVEQSAAFNYPWGKLFSAAVFRELRFPETVSFGEDNLVIYQALFACETVAFLEEKLYCYFYNSEGITKSPWDERSLQVFLGIEAQLDFYKSNGFDRAYRKEIQLHIQQCAYQIHRIREGAEVFRGNRHHLLALKKRMRRVLRENRMYHLTDQFYWFEALHPALAGICIIAGKIRRNLNKKSLKDMLAAGIARTRRVE